MVDFFGVKLKWKGLIGTKGVHKLNVTCYLLDPLIKS